VSDALDQLAALDARHAQATEARRGIDAAERAAYQAVREAEGELEALHHQRMSGDEPPGRAMEQAQRRLDRAREATRREWPLE
jgi:hypothetical protein